MTTTAADEAPAAPEAAIHDKPVTAGEALRRAREAKGLHIATLAATLKVPQSKLEAIEADRYHELPDATFARALARSMCRALKINDEPVLAMLPRGGNEASLDRVTPGLNQPFRERAASQEPMISVALLKSPVLLGVAALLVAALLVYLVPASVVDDLTRRFQREPETSASTGGATMTTTTEPTSVEAPTVASAPMVSETVPTPQPETTPAPVTSTATTPATTPAASAPVATAPAATSTTAPATALTATTTPATTAAATPAPAVPPGSAPLRVRATAETWVEVSDSQGQLLLSRLLRNGEQVDVAGVAPLKLRVGNVSGTELVFRGKPVDLAARSRDNVARLELN